METVASIVWISAIGVYLLIVGLFIFLWWQFHEVKKSYWSYRQIDVKEPIKPIDLTPRASRNGLRVKPKYNSDEKLFEFEQNPAKR